MSVILQPQSSFPIVRQIANHLDGATYYVRAVVRDADGDIIDTVNLASQGSQRYQSRYRVPVDSSGQGAYISIITSVYTDAGYTTKSSNYGDEENTYLVFDRVLSGRGSGGGSLDIGTIRRVIAEELAKVEKPEPVEMPEIPKYEMRWQEVLASVDEVRQIVSGIPTNNTVDLNPVLQAIEATYQAIESKEVTPQADMSPVVEAIDAATVDMLQQIEGLRQFVAGSEEVLTDTIVKTVEDNMKSAKFVNEFKIEPNTATKTPPQPAQPAYDINKLAS